MMRAEGPFQRPPGPRPAPDAIDLNRMHAVTILTAQPTLPRTTPAPQPGLRVTAFDSLRGIAALIVVLHHLALSISFGEQSPTAWILENTPLHILTAGRASVMLFFVLSGYALSSMMRGGLDYVDFVARRVCRIMIPFWLSILASAVLYVLLRPAPLPAVSDWMNAAMWSQALTWPSIFKHMAMTGMASDTFLSGVMWSLVYEMRISLLFPLIYIACRRAPRLTGVMAAGLFCVLAFLIQQRQIPVYATDTAAQGVMLTFYYAPFFVMGCLLHLHAAAVRHFLQNRSTYFLAALGMAAFALLNAGQDGLIGLGAATTLALVLALPRLSALLNARPIAWLGRISYSLYLTHLLVMAALFHVFARDGVLPYILALPAALACAQIFHWGVEMPAIALGRLWISARRTCYAGPSPAAS